MGRGKLSATQIQTAIFQSSGNLLSLSTINNITQDYSEGIINDDEFDGLFKGREHGTNSTEYMMKYCNNKKYYFMLLLNDPFVSPDPVSEIFFPSTHNKPYTRRIKDFNKEELESLMTNVRVGTSATQLEENQKYMMGFAWVIPIELYMLEAFPNVIMVDTVEKTNNEN